MSQGQTELQVTVTQGEDLSIEYVNEIATHMIPLPAGRGARCPIKVMYSYDLNQRMHCKFEDVTSGEVFEMDCDMDSDGKASEINSGYKKQVEGVKVE
jgi:hypothetical protein